MAITGGSGYFASRSHDATGCRDSIFQSFTVITSSVLSYVFHRLQNDSLAEWVRYPSAWANEIRTPSDFQSLQPKSKIQYPTLSRWIPVQGNSQGSHLRLSQGVCIPSPSGTSVLLQLSMASENFIIKAFNCPWVWCQNCISHFQIVASRWLTIPSCFEVRWGRFYYTTPVEHHLNLTTHYLVAGQKVAVLESLIPLAAVQSLSFKCQCTSTLISQSLTWISRAATT